MRESREQKRDKARGVKKDGYDMHMQSYAAYDSMYIGPDDNSVPTSIAIGANCTASASNAFQYFPLSDHLIHNIETTLEGLHRPIVEGIAEMCLFSGYFSFSENVFRYIKGKITHALIEVTPSTIDFTINVRDSGVARGTEHIFIDVNLTGDNRFCRAIYHNEINEEISWRLDNIDISTPTNPLMHVSFDYTTPRDIPEREGFFRRFEKFLIKKIMKLWERL